MIKIADLYKKAAGAGIVHSPDRNALQRARYHFRRNLADPGSFAGDVPFLAFLAIATADVGIRPGWIPEVQGKAMQMEKLA